MAQNGHLIGLSFEGQSVRIIERDGEPWFVASDIGQALGLVNVRDLVWKLDEDQKSTYDGVGINDAIGRSRSDTSIINESGLYELIFRSTKPEAKRFRKWVTGTVLPQIRKTGGYTGGVSAISRLENVLVDLAREHEGRIAALEMHMRPGPEWRTVRAWLEERGLKLLPGRMAKLSALCSQRSAALGLPVGIMIERKRGGRSTLRRPSFAPQVFEEVCPSRLRRWQEKDAATNP